MSTKKNVFVFALMTACLAFTTVQAKVNIQPLSKPITIVEQGSFAAGGTVLQNKGKFDPYKMGPEGQTLHGDHAYVFYQVPQNASGLPLVFLHGAGQSGKTWETTPDGREGKATLCIWSINQDGGVPAIPLSTLSLSQHQWIKPGLILSVSECIPIILTMRHSHEIRNL